MVSTAIKQVIDPAINTITVVGNHLPRRCGIATFNHDLATGLARHVYDPGLCPGAEIDRRESQDDRYPPPLLLGETVGIMSCERLDQLSLAVVDMPGGSYYHMFQSISHSLDIRAERAQLVLDILVSPLDMVDPQDLRLTLCDHSRKKQR